MREANVYVNDRIAGVLVEVEGKYFFNYTIEYFGPPISLTMPVRERAYEFEQFPPFFEGLLPEGAQLEGLLRKFKLDKQDYFSQLVQVGQDVVGAVTIEEVR